MLIDILIHLSLKVNDAMGLKNNIDYNQFDQEIGKIGKIAEIIEALEKEEVTMFDKIRSQSLIELLDVLNKVRAYPKIR
jgi:DUF1009 family protein